MINAPDLSKEILGWRCWSISDGMLHSPYLKTVWPVEQQQACCVSAAEGGNLDPEMLLVNLWGEKCLCGSVHNFVSVPTKQGCLPKAYPQSLVYFENLALPTEAKGKFLSYHQWHISPEQSCHCGWHALHSFNPHKALDSPSLVWGAILGYGKTVITPTGFRSQFAKVAGLLGDIHLLPLAKRYGVEIYKDSEQLLQNVPYKPLPFSMYPKEESL